MPLPFALDHINLWLLRDRDEDGPRRLDGRRLRHHQRRHARRWEQVFANELQGLPVLRVIVTHMHPDHIGLAHWLCERWWRMPAVDQRHRLQRRTAWPASRPPASAARPRRLLRQPRPDRPRRGGQGARARNYYAEHGAAGAAQLPPPDGRHDTCDIGGRDWRLHRRLRPRAGAHLAALRRPGRADLRRHGAAAHLHQRQRVSTWSPRPTRCRCT
jgi:glyoxylase-like metal-dependent hydrolase (beta-lactamase superfamily II)